MEKERVIALILAKLKEHLSEEAWSVSESEDHIRLKHKTDPSAGFHIAVPSLMNKLEKGKEQKQVIDAANRLIELAEASQLRKNLRESGDRIFPVLRSASHPKENQGKNLLWQNHTAESTIFYALDLGKTYVLIDQGMAEEAGWTTGQIHHLALTNVKKLDTHYKQDEVVGNIFYFFSQPDGFAASRLLNDDLMSFMRRKIEGEMGIAIPHQDVMVVADIKNDIGFQVLSKLNMDFCVKGDIPISPLPFILDEDSALVPIMVMSNPGAAPRIVRKKGE